MSFVHLHNHTEHSLLSGACKVDRLVKRALELNQKALALTDSGNLFGAVKFFFECKKLGVRPIIGCEIDVYESGAEVESGFNSESFKLTVLCENRAGYENLVKIVSFANTQKVNETVAISFSFLKSHCSGLIALSSGADGEVAGAFFGFGYERAKKVAQNYVKIFGKENFFLELQNHGLTCEKKLNECLYKISKELNLELVATNHVHYVDKADAVVHRMLNCIKFSKMFDDESFECLPNSEFYLKSAEEMRQLFGGLEKAVENTEKIAKRCNFEFEFCKNPVPKFDVEQNSKNLLFNKAKKGFLEKYGSLPSKAALQRFFYEFKVVVKMGFVDYFLIVQDYVNFARKKKIAVGPGRGSGAGSLLAFCLNITAIDPLKYGLSFERFLNPDRANMPDFDVDFCNERRHEVLNYVKKKYGKSCVAQIITFGTLAARAAVKDAARILNVDLKLADEMANLIPGRAKISLAEALAESDKLKVLIKNDARASLVFKNACLLEGYLKNTSTHAAAVVFAQNSLNSYVPLIKHENGVLIQYSMEDISRLGFLKMDFLGLRNLTVIGKCEKLIQKRLSQQFSIEKIGLNDEKTFNLLASGNSIGVFQLESKLTRKILIRFQPKKLEHLMVVMSLNRPGPSQFIDLFFGGKSSNYDFGLGGAGRRVREILKPTRGIILFQEQVMEIFREVAGYSFGRTDLIRRAIAKKDENLILKEREVFLFGLKNSDGKVESVGAVNLGFGLMEAEKIFEILTKFSSYAFNKSHAAAYSLIAYRTAYLKANFVDIYMACLMNSVVLSNKAKLLEYLSECERFKVKVLPVDVNTSTENFEVLQKNVLSFSFLAVKGIGKTLAQQIVEERKLEPFSSIENFFQRLGSKNLNKFAVKSLVDSGAFSKFEKNGKIVFDLALRFLDGFGAKKLQVDGQTSLFCGFSEQKPCKEEFVAKVLKIGKVVDKFSLKKFVFLNLFYKFKTQGCLINAELFSSLKFELCSGAYYKFCCCETVAFGKKIFKAAAIEKLVDVDQKSLALVVKLKPGQAEKLGNLKQLFDRFAGNSSVYFALSLQNQAGLKHFQKKGCERINLCNEVFSEFENLFGEDGFKIEIKK